MSPGGPLGAIFHDYILACGLHCESILASGEEEKKEGDRKDRDLDFYHKKDKGGEGDCISASPPQRAIIVSSLRVISSAELTAGKLSEYVDNLVDASTASRDTSKMASPGGKQDRQDVKTVDLCQFFQISPSDIESTGQGHGEGNDSSSDTASNIVADRVLTPVAEVECTIGSCSIPNKIIAMTNMSSSTPKEGDEVKGPETREPNTRNSFLVLHVSVSE